MTGRSFIDTNVLIYAIDRADPRKQAQALDLISTHARSRTGVISTQVLQEFFSAATRKLGVDPRQAREHLRDFNQAFDVVQVTPTIIEEGANLSILHQFSFWESLILASAATAACSELLSEDLSHGQAIQNIVIRNPFC